MGQGTNEYRGRMGRVKFMSVWKYGKREKNYSVHKIRHKVQNLLNSFRPKLSNENVEYHLHGHDNISIENDGIYALIEKLVDTAYPTYEDKYDKRWESFYIPIKRNRKIIAVPMWVMKYNEGFFIIIQSFGGFSIKNGNIDTEKFYYNIISETSRFSSIVQKDESILERLVPYDIRTGKIKGRYILERLLSPQEKKDIYEKYKNYRTSIENDLTGEIEISLNDYLNVASICYKAAYPEKTDNLSNIDMYKKWADGRHGGMLTIKDLDSKKEFSEWYYSGEHIGSHPFEIVFSWHRHGIHLYPPNDSRRGYSLIVTNYAYAWDFIEMIDALIEKQIPFVANELEAVLSYLAGDTYFTVNNHGENDFIYIPSRKHKQKYFYNIEWDDIKVVKYREQQVNNKLSVK
jgi:hypothetical protein